MLQLIKTLPYSTPLCSLQRSARAAAENSDAVFTELIRSIELKRFEVRELVKAQEKQAVDRAEQLLEAMQKELAELKRNEADLNKLSTVEDSIQFLQVSALSVLLHRIWFQVGYKPSSPPGPVFCLQGCQTLPAPPALSALPGVAAEPRLTFDLVTTALSDFQRLLQEVCQDGFVSIYERGARKRTAASAPRRARLSTQLDPAAFLF